jgi:hypothetical protein
VPYSQSEDSRRSVQKKKLHVQFYHLQLLGSRLYMRLLLVIPCCIAGCLVGLITCFTMRQHVQAPAADSKKHNVCIMTRIRSESDPYTCMLLEWIEHHLLLGVDHFYITDDCSNSTQVSKSWESTTHPVCKAQFSRANFVATKIATRCNYCSCLTACILLSGNK